MTSYFEEKTQQISPAEVSAFGIRLSTRYGKASEMVELLQFAESVAKAGILGVIEHAHYDSQCQTCVFDLVAGKETAPGGPKEQAILAAAMKTISQFEWQNTIFHGANSQP